MAIGSIFERIGVNAGGRGRSRERIAPPILECGRRFPYGPFQFKFQLEKGRQYLIESSSDLKHWIEIARDTAGGQTVEYVDSEAAKFGHRFYRLVVEEIASANVIGYASTTVPPGFSMIANPLDAPSNAVGELFKDWPDGTTVNRFDTRLFRITDNAVEFGKWTNPTEKLVPGEGAIFFNPTSDYKSLSFVGELMQGNLSMPIPSGFSVRSSLVPQPGQLAEDLGFPVGEGDVIHIFDRDRQKYVLYPYENGKWTSGSPVVNVAESFWVAKTEAANWTQSFSLSG